MEEISGVTNSQVQQASALAGSTLAKNFDTFLTLLTTQLRHQDPLSPMDSTEFTNQLVSFAGVEQQINQNKNLENLIALQKANRAATAVSFLGTRIEAPGSTTMLDNGTAEWTYTLNSNADQVALTVTDKAGNVVYLNDGPNSVGSHGFAWDGRDLFGNQLPEGEYTLNVTATDSDGNSIPVQTGIIGTVTGMQTADDDIFLYIGGISVRLSDITSVKAALPSNNNQPSA